MIILLHTRGLVIYNRLGQKKKSFFTAYFLPHTAKNTVILTDLLVWKFCGKTQFPHSSGGAKLCGNCAFPQSFHTRKSSEITVFFALSRNAQGAISFDTLISYHY